MIDVIDYGGGNLGSLVRCLRRVSADFRVVEMGGDMRGNPVILPGVGAFASVMAGLRERGFDEALHASAQMDIPFLGICVGLQVLFAESEENPDVTGLGLLRGDVVKYRAGKVPQVGWNRIVALPESGWPDGYVYFVNSYHAAPVDKGDCLYMADYFGGFCAGVRRGAVTAFQFHPERSGAFGHALVRRWIDAL